jgi:hypothetical protein
VAVIATNAGSLLDLGERGPQAKQVGQRHPFTVSHHATPTDQAREIAVQAANSVLGEPMQRGRRDDRVDLALRKGFAPPRVAQVRAYHLHAVVIGERR